MNVEIGELSAEIEKALDGMNKEVIEQMNEAIKETANDTVKELKSTSPNRTGKYAKGWDVKDMGNNVSGIHTMGVWNRPKYMLTHLLEFGHIVRATGRRTKAFPHIKDAEEHAQDEYVDKVEAIKL